MKRLGFQSFLALVALTCAGSALAQEYRGRIQGVVTDPSKAVVAGATVTLRNNNTGVAAARTTDATGHYLFDLVEPGTYNVTSSCRASTGSFRRTSWSRTAATSR